jgi:hypothetical protein
MSAPDSGMVQQQQHRHGDPSGDGSSGPSGSSDAGMSDDAASGVSAPSSNGGQQRPGEQQGEDAFAASESARNGSEHFEQPSASQDGEFEGGQHGLCSIC